LSIAGPSEAFAAGEELLGRLELDAVFLTLDKDGIAVIAKDQEPEIVPTREREVYDITGAGDMVLAMTGLSYAAGLSFAETAVLANVAAGLEIERFGVAPVTRQQIRTELNGDAKHKQVTLEEMAGLAESYRANGRCIVFANGCFDLLHMGHVTYLEQAAELGDVLIVAINSDASVTRLKGPERPIIRDRDRAAMLAALSCVHHVLVFDEDTPHHVLERLRPDILVKGGTTKTVVGKEVVARYGGSVRILDGLPDASTTSIVSRIREPACT